MPIIKPTLPCYSVTANFGGDAQAIGYYTVFFNAWNASYQVLPDTTSIPDREAFAIGQAVATILANPQIDTQTSQMIGLVASGLTVTNWNQPSAQKNLAISTMVSNIPAELSSSLGISATALVNQLYSFGPSPSSATLGNYAINLLQASYSDTTSIDAGFSVSDLIKSTYRLGSSPSDAQTWTLACTFISNATQYTFIDSPLFHVNNTSLSNLLSGLPQNATLTDINNAIDNEIVTQSYLNYPFMPLSTLTKNFINANNDTMLVFLTFSSAPDADSIAQVKLDVQSSGLQDLGKYT